MPRYAVIDVGTNSVKFHIGEKGPDFAWRTIADRAEVTRLGERLTETGEISREAMERTVTAIAGMATEAQREALSKLLPFLQERYRIPPDRIYAHNWVDYKDARYCEGCELGDIARKLNYRPHC